MNSACITVKNLRRKLKDKSMKKLKKLNLSKTDAEVLNDFDMKMILGGELVYKPCIETHSACNGVCGPKWTEGTLVSQKCKLSYNGKFCYCD